jgi:hypothetical protein
MAGEPGLRDKVRGGPRQRPPTPLPLRLLLFVCLVATGVVIWGISTGPIAYLVTFGLLALTLPIYFRWYRRTPPE